jgi:hypothetical protein
MLQSGGQGKQLSFTGPAATDIIQRLKDLPTFVHEHASGLEVELATYDTIPIPVPTEEEREDRIIVLNDCAVQKTGLLRAISDLQLTLDINGSLLFDNLPSKDELIRMLGQYRATLNGLMAHAIKVSTGRIDPPKEFIADPPPPPLPFTKKISSGLGDVPAAPPPADQSSGEGLVLRRSRTSSGEPRHFSRWNKESCQLARSPLDQIHPPFGWRKTMKVKLLLFGEAGSRSAFYPPKAALATLLLFALSFSATPGRAADDTTCQKYARAAVEDYKLTTTAGRACHVKTDPRWQPYYNNHYKWCRTAPAEWVRSEAKARDLHLLKCGARSTF